MTSGGNGDHSADIGDPGASIVASTRVDKPTTASTPARRAARTGDRHGRARDRGPRPVVRSPEPWLGQSSDRRSAWRGPKPGPRSRMVGRDAALIGAGGAVAYAPARWFCSARSFLILVRLGLQALTRDRRSSAPSPVRSRYVLHPSGSQATRAGRASRRGRAVEDGPRGGEWAGATAVTDRTNWPDDERDDDLDPETAEKVMEIEQTREEMHGTVEAMVTACRRPPSPRARRIPFAKRRWERWKTWRRAQAGSSMTPA